jgi:hypothetical protein
MPELDAKIRTTASASKRTTSGISHHFFSRVQNRINSRKTVHIDTGIIMAGRDSVERQKSVRIHAPIVGDFPGSVAVSVACVGVSPTQRYAAEKFTRSMAIRACR